MSGDTDDTNARRQTTVLVTGVGGRSVGHQILQALLPLEDRYRLVATDASTFSYGLYQAPRRYRVPGADSPDYLPAIRWIVERESVDVVLAGTQPELRMLASQRESLGRNCRLIAASSEVIDLCSDKGALYRFLAERGVSVPRTVDASEWRSLVKAVGFPIVGKPSRDTGGSRGVAILTSEKEIHQYLDLMQSERMVLQEYVGTPEDEYTVGVLVSPQGKIIDSIVLHRKLIGMSRGEHRQVGRESYVLSTGYSQGFVVRHPLIQSQCEELALQLGLRGPVNIQLRLVANKVVVFEVHPRFSGTTSIRAAVGFNEPDILIRSYLFGEQFGRLDYLTDVAAIRSFANLIVPIREMQTVTTPLTND